MVNLQGDHWMDTVDIVVDTNKASDTMFKTLATLYLQSHPRRSSDPNWRDVFLRDAQHGIERRCALVRLWADTHLARLASDSADVMGFGAMIDNAMITLKNSMRVCSGTCGRCSHLCLELQDHQGAHDCGTNHECDVACEYQDEHEDEIEDVVPKCGLP